MFPASDARPANAVAWEVEIRMCQLLCFLMSYQIVIVFSFSCIDREKGWGVVCNSSGYCLFVCVVGWVSAPEEAM